jgi:hypothetical protein
MVQAQKLQLMVLEKATEESKQAILQKYVQFTQEVMTILEGGADRPSPNTIREDREGLESIRESSEDTHF